MSSLTTPAHLTEFAGPVIITRYRGQTDNRDARILATHKRGDDETHRLYGPYRQGLESTENHRAAALALALEACRLLEVAAAGGADAAALALPVALARMATGTDHPRPLICGATIGTAPAAVTLQDHLGRTVATLPGRCSMAGALAAAAAAGWPLGAAAAATAARHQGPPDPGAVALALEARGECPAAIAALRATAAAGVAS